MTVNSESRFIFFQVSHNEFWIFIFFLFAYVGKLFHNLGPNAWSSFDFCLDWEVAGQRVKA